MSQDSAQNPGPPPKPSGWARTGGVLRDLATPLTVAIVGLLASLFVNRQETAETNRRAFAELLSQREEADTNLRREMFKTVLDSVLQKGDTDLDGQILKLEILAYNFSDSLDLAPLFQDALRRISPAKPNDPNLARLKKVAADVVFKQVEALTFDIGEVRNQPVFFEDANTQGLIFDEILTLRFPGADAAKHPPRRFQVEMLGYDPKQQELRLQLKISPPGKTSPGEKNEVEVEFAVGFFDFPSIDNTRLSNEERCSVVIRNMEEHSAQLSLVYFPANRAGLKDRMYVEEVLNQMQQVR